ncbi:MAG: ABC transporter substrate-binding protein [Bryobacteraceae bacterium]
MYKLLALLAALLTVSFAATGPAPGGVLRMGLRSEPRTFHPLHADEEASQTIRYLTAGVLIKVNRLTQAFTPSLATSWKLEKDGRTITFRLREGVRFSDGTPFGAADVAYTIGLLADPSLHNGTVDNLRGSGGAPKAVVVSPFTVSIQFPQPLAGVERLFDSLPILSARSPLKEKAILGAFRVKDYKPGQYVLLERNPNYWERDEQGRPLPYLDGIHLAIQGNRELEAQRFQSGAIHLINRLDPEHFARLQTGTHDAGPSLESEQMWFNQAPKAPIAAHKKLWFQSAGFRRAISEAIQREDLSRIAFRGLADPAAGPISPANRFWHNEKLRPHPFDPAAALARLQREGFRHADGALFDRSGNRVEFSLVTNAGNRTRERMASMVQQDLAKIGIRVQTATLEFPSLIERLTKTFDYDACLLGLVNIDLDPNGQLNVWLSSGSSHQWNPNQITPATPWEAEIDRLMRAQAATPDPRKRKALFDQVQQIVWERAPFIYLVNKRVLTAFNPLLRNVRVAQIYPNAYWNAERLYLADTPGEATP